MHNIKNELLHKSESVCSRSSNHNHAAKREYDAICRFLAYQEHVVETLTWLTLPTDLRAIPLYHSYRICTIYTCEFMASLFVCRKRAYKLLLKCHRMLGNVMGVTVVSLTQTENTVNVPY